MNSIARTLPAPVIPREHGAWGIFFGAFFSSVAVTGSCERPMVFLMLAMAIFYLIQPTFVLISRRKARRADVMWASFFFAAGGLLLVGASSVYRTIVLWCAIVVLFAVTEMLFIRSKKRQTLAAQIVGAFGLSSIAPLSYMLFEREASWAAALLWIANGAFFMCGILFARFQISRLGSGTHSDSSFRREKRRLLSYHLALVVILLGVAAGSTFRITSTFVFFPAVGVSLLAGFGCFPRTTIRQTGWLIVAQTILFVALLAMCIE